MSENPEIGYYQSLVDDLRVSQERLSEVRQELADRLVRQDAEIAQLRDIVSATVTFLADSNATNRQNVTDLVDKYLDLWATKA